MIISLLNQKGGVGKSALARALAVEFARNEWTVHIADLDKTQRTSFEWGEQRKQSNISPLIEVALYSDPRTALKAAKNVDTLIVDGKAFADAHALEIAVNSDLVIIPIGISMDDLRPSIELAKDLVNKGVAISSIVFVISRVPDNGDKEAINTANSVKAWGFHVVQGWIPFKPSYSQSMDKGKAFTETPFKSLNEKVDAIIEQVVKLAITKKTAVAEEIA